MSLYYRIADPSDVRDLGDQMAAWIASGNPKAAAWAEQPPRPAENSYWQNGQWVTPPPPTPEELARKIWPDTLAFLDEFTFIELAQIELSQSTTIAALRLFLSAWRQEVWSDDERVQTAIAALIDSGIIDAERRDEILAK